MSSAAWTISLRAACTSGGAVVDTAPAGLTAVELVEPVVVAGSVVAVASVVVASVVVAVVVASVGSVAGSAVPPVVSDCCSVGPAGRPSAACVLGPTTPSGVSPWADWKASTAAVVSAPKVPSAVIPSACCNAITAAVSDGVVWSTDASWTPALASVAVADPAAGALAAAVAARSAACSAAARASHVAGPMSPSTLSPCAAWKARIAAPVLGPSTPSTVTPSMRCASRRSPKVTLP